MDIPFRLPPYSCNRLGRWSERGLCAAPCAAQVTGGADNVCRVWDGDDVLVAGAVDDGSVVEGSFGGRVSAVAAAPLVPLV